MNGTEPLGLYIHWPFCQSKCPYCDFNSHVAQTIDQERWRRALLTELDHFAARAPGRALGSIFFGGGTPSLMEPATVAALIDRAAFHWPVTETIEITLEANPGSVDAGRFHGYRTAGVNRLSLGVQALNAPDLAFLGRRHDLAQAREAIAAAARHFPRFSFDLIYARPGQTVAAWTAELGEALAMGPSHLSVYQLTIEEGTAFDPAWRRGDFVLPDEALAAALFETTWAQLEAAGLPAYEVSNHARPGEESRHNLVYWRGLDYLGIGPGAHGRLTEGGITAALRQQRAPESWMSAVESRGHATREEIPLSGQVRRDEILMMGLRLREGVSRARFRRQTGLAIDQAVMPERLRDLCESGDLILDDHALRPSLQGLQRLNAVLTYLLA